MKAIYRKTTENYFNDELVDHHTSFNWHYGEFPEEIVLKEFIVFEEFYKEYGHENKTLFGHKPYVLCASLTSDVTFGKIGRNDFKSYKVIDRYKKIDFLITINDLVERLSAEDFIEYCKDHGLNVCPLMKG